MTQLLQKHSFSFVAITFFLLSILIVSNVYLLLPLLFDIESTFDQGEWARLFIGSTFTFFYAFGLLFFGQTCERFGLKNCLCYGLMCLTFFMFLGFWANNFYFFLLVRACQGFFAASYAPVAYLYVFNVFNQKQQVLLVSIINAGFLAASVVGQMISSVITILLSWQYVFLVFSFFYISLYFLAKRVLLSPQLKKERKNDSLFRLVKKWQLTILYFITFTLLLIFVAFFSTVTFILNNILQLQSSSILFIRCASLLGIIVSLLSVKRLFLTLGLRTTCVIGMGFVMAGVTFSAFPTVTTITIGSICVTFGISLTIPAVIKLIETTAEKQKAAAISMYSFILLLGASAGGVIALFNHYFFEYLSLFLIAAVNILLIIRIKMRKAPANRQQALEG